MKEVAVGIDIGGTFTKYGIVDKEGNCLINGSISTVQEKDLGKYLKLLKSTIDEAIWEIKEEIEVKGICLSIVEGCNDVVFDFSFVAWHPLCFHQNFCVFSICVCGCCSVCVVQKQQSCEPCVFPWRRQSIFHKKITQGLNFILFSVQICILCFGNWLCTFPMTNKIGF